MAAVLCTPPRVKKSSIGKRPVTDHKRALFPIDSPNGKDGPDELACSLSPSVYSPPLPSPSWSSPRMSPRNKNSLLSNSELNGKLEIFSQALDNYQNSPYDNSPRRSKRIQNNTPVKSPKQITNVDLLTMLDSPETKVIDRSIEADFITPQSNFTTKSPKSRIIKPISFYGSSAPLLARNEANAVAGIKKIYRIPVSSKVKTKLFTETKPSVKRRASSENTHKLKRRKEIFTGVGHSLKPEKRKSSPIDSSHSEALEKSLTAQVNCKTQKEIPIRDRIFNALDISKMPGTKEKCKKVYYYPVLKFTKPERMDVDDDDYSKRKIFKTTLKSPGRAYFDLEPQSSVVMKKRKLLNLEEDFLNVSQLTNASDILDLIEDGKEIEETDKKIKEGVDDLILHLDDELENNESSLDVDLSDICNKENELDLSNLSIADVSELSANELQGFVGSSTKTYSSPALKESNRTPLKLRNTPDKENATQTPQQKLFPVFEKRSVLMEVNKSSEKETGSLSKRRHLLGDNQYQIDAGQKRFGATQCTMCGIVYQLGDPDDEAEHDKYHKEFKTFKHSGWANEKIVGLYELDRVILVVPENKTWWNKTQSILKVIDEELGYTTEEDCVKAGLKVYLYINKKQIAGCLVATQISHAYRMLISEPGIDICSEDSFPVKCGISRIWTHPMYRRQGIASRLVDTMRKSFFFGFCMTMDDIAFSAPTENGREFAKKYTGRSDYLIYTGW